MDWVASEKLAPKPNTASDPTEIMPRSDEGSTRPVTSPALGVGMGVRLRASVNVSAMIRDVFIFIVESLSPLVNIRCFFTVISFPMGVCLRLGSAGLAVDPVPLTGVENIQPSSYALDVVRPAARPVAVDIPHLR